MGVAVAFGKPPNPLSEDWVEGYESYAVNKLEAKMQGAFHYPSRCGCLFKPTSPGRVRVVRRCEQHKNIEPGMPEGFTESVDDEEPTL